MAHARTQLELFHELSERLGLLSRETWQARLRSSWVWVEVCKEILKDLTANRARIDEQLVLLESEVPAASARVAAIRKVMGIVAVATVTFACGAVVKQSLHPDDHLHIRAGATTVRAAGRKTEEVA